MTHLPKPQRDLASGTGHGPAGGFAPLVPELDVADIDVSLRFWCDLLGFSVAYDRPTAKFAYLEREGAQIMLCQINGNWDTGTLERPFGRGINFQIGVTDLQPAISALEAAAWPLFRPLAEIWYRIGTAEESGARELLVQDPDGYLVRLSQNIGTRAVA
jgi:catechol 2,3-dioxygenase-like lactoylglutathione lyase family enzyme